MANITVRDRTRPHRCHPAGACVMIGCKSRSTCSRAAELGSRDTVSLYTTKRALIKMAKVSPALMRESHTLLDSEDPSIYAVTTRADGPAGSLPLTDEMLKDWPSGDLFGLVQNAGMGWTAAEVARDPFLILSTQGGLRGADGHPIALGYHTGHWEVGILVEEAAVELKRLGMAPFAGMVSDPCDGRTQGTAGMMDSLPYRNDAAIVFRRLIRSLPTSKGVIGIATCDKGLPAMMMALASSGSKPSVLVPGGVTLLPESGEDAGKVQSIGARFAQ